jgi:hypothetical protein
LHLNEVLPCESSQKWRQLYAAHFNRSPHFSLLENRRGIGLSRIFNSPFNAAAAIPCASKAPYTAITSGLPSLQDVDKQSVGA